MLKQIFNYERMKIIMANVYDKIVGDAHVVCSSSLLKGTEVGHILSVKCHKDLDNGSIVARGAFVEVIRLGIGGQCSFSTTVPDITRGNHYHTRKIERFAVIKGKALIQLRKIDTDEVLDFYLDGTEPAYVDMPIWYTHNIKNIGAEDLYTIFWIDEPFNPEDADTYFETV